MDLPAANIQQWKHPKSATETVDRPIRVGPVRVPNLAPGYGTGIDRLGRRLRRHQIVARGCGEYRECPQIKRVGSVTRWR